MPTPDRAAKRTLLAAVCLLAAAQDLPAADGAAPKNLARNPSFELCREDAPLAESWNGPAEVYSVDRGIHHRGRASLKFSNADEKRYALCTQKVAVRPGRKYRFSVWIKTRGIAGNESGATICMEWQDAKGKWLGGSYPPGVKGTRDWTRVEGITRVPKDAGSCSLTCYVRKGMTGTAWFDDAELLRVADPPMRTVLVSPLYRGRVTAGGPQEGRVRVHIDLTDYDFQLAQLRLDARARSLATDRIVWREDARPGGSPYDLSFSTRSWKTGKYDLEIRLLGPDGEALQAAHHRLVRVPDGFRPRVTIDPHRRLLVDGKPFFPLGMYFSSITGKDIEQYAGSKFNCLMPYGAPDEKQMDLAARHGLKVIYSIKDWYAGSRYCPASIRTRKDEEPAVRARVRRFRSHPALLAWYLNDELPQSFLPQLGKHQRWVEEEDPDHPTWVVLYQYRQIAAYIDTFDVIGTDPYPIGRAPASWAADWTAETLRQVDGARPLWQVPQAHNWANYWKDPAEKKKAHTPTFDEERSMAWQCICEGATGLVFYSWYDIHRNPDVPFETQWNVLKRIAAEIDRWAPVLLSAEPAPAVEVRPDATDSGSPAWLHWIARRRGGKLYLFAANDGDGEGSGTFMFPAPLKAVRVPGEKRSIQPDGSRFRDDFKKLAVHIYEIEP